MFRTPTIGLAQETSGCAHKTSTNLCKTLCETCDHHVNILLTEMYKRFNYLKILSFITQG